MNRIITSQNSGQASLTTLLHQLGFRPTSWSGSDRMYFNVLRNTDTKPCFSVNEQLDVWYDHISKKGGNLLDFGMAYWPDLSPEDVAEKIGELTEPVPEKNCNHRRKRKATKLPNYQIHEIKPLGFNEEIRAYLELKGIWEQGFRF